MQKYIITLGIIFLLTTFIICLSLSGISWFNLLVSSFIILATMGLTLYVDRRINNKGFKVSLYFLIPFVGLTQYILALCMNSQFTDNWCFIAILSLFCLEASILTITHFISKK